MTCTHPRQPHPGNPARRLPCAWPGCDEGHEWGNYRALDARESVKTRSYERHHVIDDIHGLEWFEWVEVP